MSGLLTISGSDLEDEAVLVVAILSELLSPTVGSLKSVRLQPAIRSDNRPTEINVFFHSFIPLTKTLFLNFFSKELS